MRYNEVGTSGIKVSALGMGCWSYGGGAYWGNQSQKDVENVVAAALDRGVNFFDTAEMYNDGESEKALALALKGRRKEAIIASKISPPNAGKVRDHVLGSLKRLGADYLDLYMLHWPINAAALEHFAQDREKLEHPPTIESAYRQMEDCKKEGLVRCIGMSNFGVSQMKEITGAGIRVDFNEMPYNIVSRAIEAEITPFCMEQKIGIVGSMALAQGLLAGIYQKIEDIPAPQAHSRHFKQERGGSESRHYEAGAEEEIFVVIDLLRRIASESGHTMAEISLAWVLSKPFMTSTLAGSRNIKELENNIAACDLELSKDIITQIDEASLPVWKKLGNSPDYYENREKSRIY